MQSATFIVTAGPDGEISPADRKRLNEMLEADDRFQSRKLLAGMDEPEAATVTIDTESIPCPVCKKTRAAYLTLSEAYGLGAGYARSRCVECMLTDVRREKTSAGLFIP